MNITQVIGIEEAVKLICREMEKFAAPKKLPDRKGKYENYRVLGNVEIWFSPKGVGIARFHCATWDNIDLEVEVDFTELSREYLDNLTHDIDQKINLHRAGRMRRSVHESVADTVTAH